jgi:ABC transport system ATP-binding/permease protein
MHKLVIQDDEGKTTVVPLIRDEITVGRKEGNTIRLTERNVSRRHARIVRKNGSVAIEDLNSYNGVRVNGSRIQGRVGLSVSDRVQIGDYLIELKADTGVVEGVESYGDETQPMDTADLDLRRSSPSLPAIPQLAMQDADAATTKMPLAPMMPGASMPPPPAPPPAAAEHLAPGAVPPQVQEASPARLVILSTSFAGRELELSKPAMVIGRTDDNDLVVSHRSISRHHAKIVRENGRYAIVDLQSSNGVRVNGEEYSKVELRRADLIDLGHVRLRFVEPGEDFVFGRDAQAVSLATGGGRGLIYAGAAVLLVGMIAVFALTRGGDDGEPTEQTALTKPDDDDQAGTKVTQEDRDVQKAVIAEPDIEKIKPHIDEARSAIDAEKWDKAVEAANQALAIQPRSEEARQLASNAQTQKENESRFNVFKQAVKKRDYPQVATSFEAIDSDSIYKNRARDDHDRLQGLYKDSMLKRARLLAKKNKCNEVDALAAEARGVWSAVADAVASVECKKPVAIATSTGNTSTASNTTTKKTPPETVVESNSDSTDDSGDGSDDEDGSSSSKPSKPYEQLMTESRAAYMSGQYGKARRLCNDALKLKPRDQEAATLCGFAACNMKNAKMAKRYQAMLPETRKSSVRQTCLKAGIRDFE